MKGYVKNIGKAPIYIFKRVVNSDEVIAFDDLLERFGNVADTSSEKAFADWLSKNKFVDKSRWQIVTRNAAKVKKVTSEKSPPREIKTEVERPEKVGKVEKVEVEEMVSKVTATNKEIIKKVVTGVSKEMTADDIADMSVSQMKKNLPKIDDVKLLKLALKKAESMQQKATLCNGLRDRIAQLSVR